MEPKVSEILRILERRVADNERMAKLTHSKMAEKKARARWNESQQILGLIRIYVEHPERI